VKQSGRGWTTIARGRMSAAGAPRTLRLDRLVWNDAGSPATVTVNGPTTLP